MFSLTRGFGSAIRASGCVSKLIQHRAWQHMAAPSAGRRPRSQIGDGACGEAERVTRTSDGTAREKRYGGAADSAAEGPQTGSRTPVSSGCLAWRDSAAPSAPACRLGGVGVTRLLGCGGAPDHTGAGRSGCKRPRSSTLDVIDAMRACAGPLGRHGSARGGPRGRWSQATIVMMKGP